VNPLINSLYKLGLLTPHVVKALLKSFWLIRDGMLPDPVGIGTEGGMVGLSGVPPEQGFKSLKQYCPLGQSLLLLQELPHPLFAASQLDPQRTLLEEEEVGAGFEMGLGRGEGGVPPQAGKSL
jgi:hypothetical protein